MARIKKDSTGGAATQATPELMASLVKSNGEQLAEFKKELNIYKQELNDYKIKMIEIVGIFVALFTFISVDIQIFKSLDISILGAVGFILVMLGALVGFVGFLNNTLSRNNQTAEDVSKRDLNKTFGIYLISCLMLVVIGVCCIVTEHKAFPEKLKDTFFTKDQVNTLLIQYHSTSTQFELDNLKKCFRLGGWKNCLEPNN